MTNCCEQNCEGRARTRGLCHKHYQRYLAAGGAKKQVVKGSPLERFHQLYTKVNNGCWIWKGYVPENGVPVIGQGKKWSSARRFYYEVLHGQVSPKKLIWSTCNNSLCVNPEHAILEKPKAVLTPEEMESRKRLQLERQAIRDAGVAEARRKAQFVRDNRRREKQAAIKKILELASDFRSIVTGRDLEDDYSYSFCALLPRGEHTIIDVAIMDWFFSFRWDAFRQKGQRTEPYVVTHINGRQLRLHRLLLDCPEGLVVDHINNNPVDNRVSNLRIATQAQNCFNIRKLKASTSAFKGVTLCRNSLMWKAYIRPPNYPRGKKLRIGLFTCELDAARAYNEAATLHFGEFAYLNKSLSQ